MTSLDQPSTSLLHRVQHPRARACLRCALAFALPALLSGCAAAVELPIGRLAIGLTSGLGDSRYRLSGASFQLTGTAELELESNDDPTADVLERALPSGRYELTLAAGWQLLLLGEQARPVAADLVSDNPVAFEITTGDVTAVDFQFETHASALAENMGSLRVGIEVDGVGAPRVIITEAMLNPQALPDAQGEWIELYNASDAAVDLGGCSLTRDDQSHVLAAGFTLAPRQYATFANGAEPGFAPTASYRGLTLPNTGAFTLRVSCGQQVLDSVSLGSAPNAAGHSVSLSAASLAAPPSERALAWCDAATSYNGDFGTPGSANPNCL